MQKYPIKGKVRSCHKWTELYNLAVDSYEHNMITYPSFLTIKHIFIRANQDDVDEFKELKELLLKALNGKGITRY